jgi:hypothetical protein
MTTAQLGSSESVSVLSVRGDLSFGVPSPHSAWLRAEYSRTWGLRSELGIGVTQTFDPPVEDNLAGVEIFKGDADAGRLLAGGGWVVGESSGAPGCGSPLGGIGEALEQEVFHLKLIVDG